MNQVPSECFLRIGETGILFDTFIVKVYYIYMNQVTSEFSFLRIGQSGIF